jgi:hypothetical protein
VHVSKFEFCIDTGKHSEYCKGGNGTDEDIDTGLL